MNSTKTSINEKTGAVIKDFIQDFRLKGISALAYMREDEQKNIVNWARDVVNQYGSLLQESPAKIKDRADLPCPREDLKVAIKVLLPAYLSKGSDETVDQLKDRYARLSVFQAINREDKEAINKESTELDQKSVPADSSLFPIYQKYMQIIISEQKIFLEDINTFIEDLPHLE